jgi:hypothetical protein
MGHSAQTPLWVVLGSSGHDVSGQGVWARGRARWKQIDLKPLLDVGKTFKRLRAWGYSGGGMAQDITRFDHFSFCQ